MSHELVTFMIALLAIVNPIGSGMIYLSLVKHHPPALQQKILISCVVTVMVILLLSAWMGALILRLFGITLGAFESAGGLILLLTGLSMVRGGEQNNTPHPGDATANTQSLSSIGIVPLALTLVAGPGAISMTIIYSQELSGWLNELMISVICIAMALLMGLVFKAAPFLGRLLGEEGSKVVSRIMGLILAAIALQMIGNGLSALLPGLK